MKEEQREDSAIAADNVRGLGIFWACVHECIRAHMRRSAVYTVYICDLLYKWFVRLKRVQSEVRQERVQVTKLAHLQPPPPPQALHLALHHSWIRWTEAG